MKVVCIHKAVRPHRIHRAWYESIDAEYFPKTGFFSTPPKADVYIIDGMASIPPLLFHDGKVILLNSDTFFYNLKRAGFFKKLIYNFCLGRVDAIISTSNMLRDMAKPHTCVPHKVVYPFAEEKFFKVNMNPNSKNIGYFGRFTEEKNLDLIVRVFKRLKNKGKLYLIGGEYKTDDKDIIVVPFTDRVEDYMKKCGLFIMLSRYDSFGVSIIESMAMGLPTVVSNTCGAKEIVSPDFVVELNEDKIVEIINNLTLKQRKEYGRYNKLTAINYTKDRSIKRFKEAFTSVI